ncbi:serine/arginine repetitive matrix protein 1 isoform X2 [Fopius arisanus]|uniref:Serine/arginine repetitive matrix protein 1 isoform X2 n=1 Tax=Fopius arisanus TaxID=64838 RepID=A0A9R1TYA0_9HYME|nr:PREDICTED: serine/arginine repetitive matrix protein 1 isoform X2 [Fopius arisanus]
MEVISTRRYEARPAVSTIHSGLLYDPNSKVATVKEEEWETRKKKEITTTRQIETRVKRQVVLEDGEVVKDSGPLVTTNTTEDVEQQEHTTQERKTNGDEPNEVEWTSPSAGPVVQKELNETIVRSREETEELLETEDRRQFGDITDEAYQQAVRNNRGDLRQALAESSRQVAVSTGPRIVQHKTKSNKVIDTEKILERKEFKADGAIVTETKKSVEHEEIGDDEVPEGEEKQTGETRKESSQRFIKQREEDVVDYVAGGERIAREMRFVAEKTEGERTGDWPPSPDRMRTVRLPKPGEKPSHNSNVSTASPKHYMSEGTMSVNRPETVTYTRNYETSTRRHHETRGRSSPPSPPTRRRTRERVSEKVSHREENYQNSRGGSSPSPVNVITRTWQNRTQDWSEPGDRGSPRRHPTPPKSRSQSPVVKIASYRDKKENIRPVSRSESPRGSKSRIGESFRKLVGKLRSVSSERKNKKNSDSKSQLTQTDDSSTYLQYNVIDRNIPEVGIDQVDRGDDKPPERPPRSPRVSPTTIKVTRSNNDHKYYVTDESYAPRSYEALQDSHHHSSRVSRHHEKLQKSSRISDDSREEQVSSSTLGRLSKSTSRLTNDQDEEYHRGIQTLPRKLQSSSPLGKTSVTRRSSKQVSVGPRAGQARNYGSMINISIKNVKSSQGSTHRSFSPTQGSPGYPIPPVKPERTYKSSLLRSKSFNVEATNGNGYPERTGYKSNSQLNSLDETQPLKSPGILASISRSNRDLFKHEYY